MATDVSHYMTISQNRRANVCKCRDNHKLDQHLIVWNVYFVQTNGQGTTSFSTTPQREWEWEQASCCCGGVDLTTEGQLDRPLIKCK